MRVKILLGYIIKIVLLHALYTEVLTYCDSTARYSTIKKALLLLLPNICFWQVILFDLLIPSHAIVTVISITLVRFSRYYILLLRLSMLS